MAKQKKKRCKAYRPRAVSLASTYYMLASSCVDSDVGENDVQALLLKPNAILARLRMEMDAGGQADKEYAFDHDDFRDLNQAVISGWCLGAELKKAAAQEFAKQEIDKTAPVFTDAAAALHSIGERFGKLGRWGYTGSEYKAISAALAAYADLVPLATIGLIVRALRNAESMIIDELQRLERLHKVA